LGERWEFVNLKGSGLYLSDRYLDPHQAANADSAVQERAPAVRFDHAAHEMQTPASAAALVGLKGAEHCVPDICCGMLVTESGAVASGVQHTIAFVSCSVSDGGSPKHVQRA